MVGTEVKLTGAYGVKLLRTSLRSTSGFSQKLDPDSLTFWLNFRLWARAHRTSTRRIDRKHSDAATTPMPTSTTTTCSRCRCCRRCWSRSKSTSCRGGRRESRPRLSCGSGRRRSRGPRDWRCCCSCCSKTC